MKIFLGSNSGAKQIAKMTDNLIVELRACTSYQINHEFDNIKENFYKLRKKNQKKSKKTGSKYNIDIFSRDDIFIDDREYKVLLIKNGIREILNKKEDLLGYQIIENISFNDVSTNSVSDRGIIHVINFLNREIYDFLFSGNDDNTDVISFNRYHDVKNPEGVVMCVSYETTLENSVYSKMFDLLSLDKNDLFFVFTEPTEILSKDIVMLENIGNNFIEEKVPNFGSIITATPTIIYTGPSTGVHKNKLYNMMSKKPCDALSYRTRNIIRDQNAIVIDNYLIISEELIDNYKHCIPYACFVVRNKDSSIVCELSNTYVQYNSREYESLIQGGYVLYDEMLIPPDNLSKPCKEQIAENIRIKDSSNPQILAGKVVEQHHKIIKQISKTPSSEKSYDINRVRYWDGRPEKTLEKHYGEILSGLTGAFKEKYGQYSITISVKIGDHEFNHIEVGEKNSDGIFINGTSQETSSSQSNTVVNTRNNERQGQMIPSDSNISMYSEQPTVDKIRNPDSGRMIGVGGVTYKNLLKKGYIIRNNIFVKSE